MDDWTRARQDLDARESSKKEAKRRITDDMSSAEKEQMMRESEQEQARKEREKLGLPDPWGDPIKHEAK